ncbi:CAAX prenyl protease 2-like [Penaeus indicus]|uniref:CAAX prenyl protease 2-like n=1 Tax=Penaeus indicus TaxID=29960 RepID=UPI00300CF419
MSSICLNEIFACFLLSVLYVGSLYVWNATQGRDHPTTIKKRCISVFFMTIVSPFFIIWFGNKNIEEKVKYLILCMYCQKKCSPHTIGVYQLGSCTDHPTTIKKRCISVFFMTIVSPFFIIWFGNKNIEEKILHLRLTVAVNLNWKGDLLWYFQHGKDKKTLQTFNIHFTEPLYWYNTVQNPIWWRNQVVAPFSEEFTFRACMLPILLQCVSPGKAVFIAPLFFGVAHLHHAVDRLRLGIDLPSVILLSCFQFLYTSVFGFYSAFLFIRTGHFLPLFAVHAFCNHMGLPEMKEMLNKPTPVRNKLMAFHVLGLVAWYFLLYPLTEPSLYSNTLYVL